MPPVRPRQPPGLRFTITALCVALFGARIGLPAGAAQISVVGPAVLSLAAVAFVQGHLRFHRTRAAIFILLCGLTLISAAVNMIEPHRFGVEASWTSLEQFLLLTSLLTLRFTEPVDEKVFYTGVNTLLALIAVAGILQFAAQFAGLSLFSFHDILPEWLSFENGYNLLNPIVGTPYMKSNGFFLLEASIFSQYMALGLAIEIVLLRRVRYILLMLCGLVVSQSGTGWIVLGSFIVAVAVGLKGRGVVLALATICLLVAGMIVVSTVAPDFFEAFSSRIGEFDASGSSAHARFVSPFWMVSDVIGRAPWAWWAGVGAGVGERMTILLYLNSLNTPVKLLVEFGSPVMLTYVVLLAAGRKTRVQGILLVPGLIMVLLMGNYAQTPPVLYPVVLIVSIATLERARRPGVAALGLAPASGAQALGLARAAR